MLGPDPHRSDLHAQCAFYNSTFLFFYVKRDQGRYPRWPAKDSDVGVAGKISKRLTPKKIAPI